MAKPDRLPGEGRPETISLGGKAFDARVNETEQAVHVYYQAIAEDHGSREGLLQALDSIAGDTDKPVYYHATG